MKSRALVFNGFLTLLSLALATGCGTTEDSKRKKEMSTIRIHLESDGQADHSSAITVHRSAPFQLNIEREVLLDEHNVIAALLVEQPGGFAIQVQFDRTGSWTLEQASVMRRGRHLAVHAHFGPARWLAAPVLRDKISSGKLTFTPDCTREEAERFLRGLNNAVRKLREKEAWPLLSPLEK